MNDLVDGRQALPPVDAMSPLLDEQSERQYSSGISAAEQILLAVSNHRQWVIGIIVGSLLLGLLATFLATPQYESTARIEILPDSPVATNVEGQQDRRIINEVAFYNTQYSLLESRSLAERVVRAGNLSTDKDFIATYELENPEAGMTSAERQTLQNSAAKILLNSLSVEPVRNSSLVDVSFSTPSPMLSAKLADLWVTQFLQASIDRRFAATSDARQYLQGRLSTLRESLEASERALINYSTSKGIVTISTETDTVGRTTSQTLVGSDIDQISKAVAKAREMRIAAEAELANQQTGSAQINAPTIGSLRESRAATEAELAHSRTQFGEDYPAVVALKAQLKVLEQAIKDETTRSSRSNRESYNAAVKREGALEAELNELTNKYNAQQRESIQMAILQREVDSNRQLYEGLLQRSKEIGVSGVGPNNISLVDRAKAANAPSSPSLSLNLALALLLGGALAAAVVFLLEKMDSSVRDPQVVVSRFQLPLLGAIPELINGEVADAILDKKSAIYEAYFSLMTNLTFLTEHGAPKSLMLTSSRPKEGKSNSTLSLATVLAATGKSVVLVDADVRNPSINRYLDIPNQRGLSHYLSGDNDIDGMISPLETFGFSIITAGKTPPNAAELLGSERLGTLIDTLLERFDHVLVDSPPLLGLADAPLIARRVEGVVFTIEANSTRNREISTALTRLRMSGARLFGAIVTKVGAKNHIYGYGYGYGYGYTYGADKGEE